MITGGATGGLVGGAIGASVGGTTGASVGGATGGSVLRVGIEVNIRDGASVLIDGTKVCVLVGPGVYLTVLELAKEFASSLVHTFYMTVLEMERMWASEWARTWDS